MMASHPSIIATIVVFSLALFAIIFGFWIFSNRKLSVEGSLQETVQQNKSSEEPSVSKQPSKAMFTAKPTKLRNNNLQEVTGTPHQSSGNSLIRRLEIGDGEEPVDLSRLGMERMDVAEASESEADQAFKRQAPFFRPQTVCFLILITIHICIVE